MVAESVMGGRGVGKCKAGDLPPKYDGCHIDKKGSVAVKTTNSTKH
jgi:hypothetical protein